MAMRLRRRMPAMYRPKRLYTRRYYSKRLWASWRSGRWIEHYVRGKYRGYRTVTTIDAGYCLDRACDAY